LTPSWLRYEQHVEAALQGGATIKGQVMPHELVGKVGLGDQGRTSGDVTIHRFTNKHCALTVYISPK